MEELDIELDRLAEQAAQIVAPLFSLYGWTYGEKHSPSFYEIKDTIAGLFTELKKQPLRVDACSTGRFTVTRGLDDQDELHYNVYLDLASS